ncbi:MAG: response regulator [Phormidesmis sp.]
MNATILVIEDEDETREIFLRCLTFENFNAIGAKEGAKGIELAKVHRPDLIVCDIMMPEMDGYGVLKAVRRDAHLQTSPFIFLTAKVTMEDLRQGMALGADDYLAKPCTIEQFLSAIATRLQRKQEIQRSLQSATPQHTTATTPFSIFPDCPKLAPVFQFIDSHYQQPIHLSDVAQAAGYTPSYLTNLSQNHTGRTVKKWITERRMAQARQLLKDTARSIKQISEDIGYTDAGYFTRQFRKLHGVPPKSWRRNPTD